MRNKIITFLLLLNFIATLTVGYTLYTHEPKEVPYIVEVLSADDEAFKENVYKALGMMMSGQARMASNQEGLNMALYRVHHFVKPHVELHPNCPECEIDKQKILDEENKNVTFGGERL